MAKVFISQKMSNLSDEEIIRRREEIKNKLNTEWIKGVEIIDTYYTDMPATATRLDYLIRSLQDLSKADVVYFDKGWNTATGCIIEFLVSVWYDKSYVTYNNKRFKTVAILSTLLNGNNILELRD